jgi:hypothetical protein
MTKQDKRAQENQYEPRQEPEGSSWPVRPTVHALIDSVMHVPMNPVVEVFTELISVEFVLFTHVAVSL